MTGTSIRYRRFIEGAWSEVTEWARDVTQRLNEEGVGLSVLGVSGVAKAPRADIVGSASMPLRVSDDGTTLAFGPISPARAMAAVPAAMRNATVAVAIPNNAVTVVALPTATWTSTSADTPTWDGTTNAFTITRAGLYTLSARTAGIPAATAGRWATIIQVNGTNVAQDGTACGAGVPAQVGVSMPWSLAVGDTVKVAVFQNSGAAVNTLVSSSDWPMLSVVYAGSL